MIEQVIQNFLASLTERELDEPLRAVLRAQGFFDIHFVHGPSEFGRDFIAKRDDDGTVRQYAIQSKVGAIDIKSWREIRHQIEDIRTGSLSHPSFDANVERVAVLVTTGRLVGDARVSAQDYGRQYADEMAFDVWDGDRLVEYIVSTPEAAMAGRNVGPLLGVMGSIETEAVSQRSIERFSRRWIPAEHSPVSPATVLEAAIVATRLRQKDRLDLACDCALGLLRAAVASVHGHEPLQDDAWASGSQAGGMFEVFATELWERCDERSFEPVPFASSEALGLFATYSVRCARVVELLGLLLLYRQRAARTGSEDLETFLQRFVTSQPGAGHPLSDRYGVSLLAPSIALGRYPATVESLLRSAARWVADRYEGELLGLASVDAEPEAEVGYLLSALESVAVEGRRESFLATVILDLAAACELGSLYEDARNDFLAVDAAPELLHTLDNREQYLSEGESIAYEINPPFDEAWVPREGWKSAHHHDADAPRWLERVGRSWEQIALWSLLRDRYDIGLVRRMFLERKALAR